MCSRLQLRPASSNFSDSAQGLSWPRANGKRVRDFRKKWESACDAAGVPDLLFHDLRRTAARNLRRAGVPETVIMKIGGWRTRSVFERYAIVSRNDIADAMLQLQQSEKTNDPQNGHIIGHSDPPAQMGTVPPTVN